ncbi:hypothetical protein LCGC14_2293490 [marine sediment metagenome]|uniref:Phage ABA sandwich domain-containing protein n=1 Tax=marine sediment metagenome TaxID=412755 RepID=A0A0F9DD41_9ZZZZ
MELNKKLAEWAGFKYIYQATNGGWYYYEYQGGEPKPIPNFTESLDACFKHLEPELYRRGYRYQLTRLQDGHRMYIYKFRKGWGEPFISSLQETASLAFCDAVEKLIEAEDGN